MTAPTTFGTISDQAVQALRSLIGKDINRTHPYVEELNADAIRHWAHGIGDDNPLWTDPDYARRTPYGDVLAPGSILFATDRVLSGYVTGLPGIHAMFAGASFRWSRRLRRGDVIRCKAQLDELIERPSKFAGRSFQQIYAVTAHDGEGAVTAEGSSWCFRTERDSAREAGKYEGVLQDATWSTEQIEDLARRYREQEARRRGATPRFVSEVAVGDPLPEILKGPYTATTAISFLLGWGGLYVRGHGHAFDLYERHPALAIPNEWGVPEPPERVHWDPLLAARVGVPGAYDYGPERVAWMGHVVTDWMGDAGFLRELYVEVRQHNLIGDLVVCEGEVSEVDESTGEVGITLKATDQRGNESARGSAVVMLPRRGEAIAQEGSAAA